MPKTQLSGTACVPNMHKVLEWIPQSKMAKPIKRAFET